jgi:hypothetical protein
MAPLMVDAADPVAALVAVFRQHAIYCRRDVARVMIALRVELHSRDHPVGRAVQAAASRVIADTTRLITDGRRQGAIPPGPPPRVLARAVITAVEGLVIELGGRAPFDVELAERAVLGLLVLSPGANSASR